MSEIIFGSDGERIVNLPEIADVKAYGGFVYVEVLSSKELLRTNLDLPGSQSVPVNEAYVLDIGPQVPAAFGLEVGHRVFISGDITFGPNYGDYSFTDEGRKRGMVLYTSIRGRSVEVDKG